MTLRAHNLAEVAWLHALLLLAWWQSLQRLSGRRWGGSSALQPKPRVVLAALRFAALHHH
jgi:hypothetical protein